MDSSKAAAGGWVVVAGLFAASAGYDVAVNGGLSATGSVWLALTGVAVALAVVFAPGFDAESDSRSA